MQVVFDGAGRRLYHYQDFLMNYEYDIVAGGNVRRRA